LADDGIHQLDLAMMLLGDPWPPKSVSAVGGRYAFQDAREVPDVQSVWYDFHRLVLTMEMTNYPPNMDKIAQDIRQTDAFPYWPQCSTRVELYGSKGLMVIGVHGGGWQVFGKPAKQSRPGEIVAEGPARPGDVPHIENFLSCIRSRSKPNADIELGHKSMMLVHMGNIAHRVGNAKLAFDARGERFPGNDAANRLLHRKDRAGWEVPERV
jgi:predicted dehydrogenase